MSSRIPVKRLTALVVDDSELLQSIYGTAGLLHTLDRYRNEMRTVAGDSDATDDASMGGMGGSDACKCATEYRVEGCNDT